MAYVIGERCTNLKDRARRAVPDRPRTEKDKGDRLLYICPDECIDCGACEPVCPGKAIRPEDEVPAQWKAYIEMNADYYKLSREAFKEKWGVEP